MNLQGKPIIQIIYEKASRIKDIDKVIVATTNSQTDDVLEEFCMLIVRSIRLDLYMTNLA